MHGESYPFIACLAGDSFPSRMKLRIIMRLYVRLQVINSAVDGFAGRLTVDPGAARASDPLASKLAQSVGRGEYPIFLFQTALQVYYPLWRGQDWHTHETKYKDCSSDCRTPLIDKPLYRSSIDHTYIVPEWLALVVHV